MGNRSLFTHLAAMLLLSFPLILAPPHEQQTFDDDPRALELFAALLESVMGGLSDVEAAAFIVRDGDSHRLQLWPKTLNKFKASFEGALPKNLVAIAHTHPITRVRPSDEDIAVAKRLNLAMYVVTRVSIFKVSARGAVYVACTETRMVR